MLLLERNFSGYFVDMNFVVCSLGIFLGGLIRFTMERVFRRVEPRALDKREYLVKFFDKCY